MKKTALFVMLISGITLHLYAQTFKSYEMPSPTEMMFNMPKPYSLPYNFTINLLNGNKITFELTNLQQLDSIHNIDSIAAKVWQDLQPLKDSLIKPLVSRRVDYASAIRIVEYPQNGNIYVYRKGELMQTKVEQDTLRIRMFTKGKWKVRLFRSNKDTVMQRNDAWYIMFRLNNITDIADMQPQMIDSVMEEAKTSFRAKLKKFKKWEPLTGNYYVHEKSSQVYNPKGAIQQRNDFLPYVQTGLQYARGNWAPSAGAGVEIMHVTSFGARNYFRIFWEPYFFFTSTASNSVAADRNDFVTFKLTQKEEEKNNTLIAHSVSLSYLIKRKGNWFEPSTFKFGVAGLHTKSILIEPEFIFNKFFKNFSPSLKFTLTFNDAE